MKDSLNIYQLETKNDKARAANLAEYIRTAKNEHGIFDVEWTNPYWESVGYFVKQSHAPKGSLKSSFPEDACLDHTFIDFAKAYVTERHLSNPGESRSGHIKRLQTLRSLESSLLEIRGNADPLLMDLAVFDKAAEIARKNLKRGGAHRVGCEIKKLAGVMVGRGILPVICNEWASPNKPPKYASFGVDTAAEIARQKKLPDPEALGALAAIFNRNLDPADTRLQRDIYTTSVTALLMCAPSRGQEIHRLPANLTFEATDKFGDDQLGLRLHASKGYGAYVKWVWSEMVPVAEKAILRLKAITEEARTLALHLENPSTCSKFYRHTDCPEVLDDEPLTEVQMALALGFNLNNPRPLLNKNGLSRIGRSYTLQTLWTDFVLPRHRKLHPHFPYVSEKDKALGSKGGLKYSDALFCMRANQLSTAKGTSPVTLWIPNLQTYNFEVGPSNSCTSIFDRYGYAASDGSPFKLTSHQMRHLLNTEAHRSGLTDEQIAHWSGRKDIGQNSAYDHRSVSEHIEQARPIVEKVQASLALTKDQVKDVSLTHGQWQIKIKFKPRSCEDIADIQPHLTGLATLYGECHHDWAFTPCEGFVHCLDCNEHACIKGNDEDAQTKLRKLETLKQQVMNQVTRAKQASIGDVDAQDWLQTQEKYAAKVDELIAILTNPSVPDGSAIRSANGQHPTHTHRALRGLGMKALERGTESEEVMKRMLASIDNGLKGESEDPIFNQPRLSQN